MRSRVQAETQRLYKSSPIAQKPDVANGKQGALTMMIIRSTGRTSLSIMGAGVFTGQRGA
ncbi:hypothetical protein [Fulvimarina pelagi]|uniref:hypothetical protein n=1 Tax=Fulvimarina pelagi TaxID=217511 RepID=UPI00058F2554|nr:hypothetical protein [Fulvimarina pelagi]